MRADGDVYALALSGQRVAAILFDSEDLIRAPSSFLQDEFGAKGEQRVRVNVRIDLIVGDEETLRDAARLRFDREQQAVAVEILRAFAHEKRSGGGRLFDAR